MFPVPYSITLWPLLPVAACSSLSKVVLMVRCSETPLTSKTAHTSQPSHKSQAVAPMEMINLPSHAFLCSYTCTDVSSEQTPLSHLTHLQEPGSGACGGCETHWNRATESISRTKGCLSLPQGCWTMTGPKQLQKRPVCTGAPLGRLGKALLALLRHQRPPWHGFMSWETQGQAEGCVPWASPLRTPAKPLQEQGTDTGTL